jgi:hypothetical protein
MRSALRSLLVVAAALLLPASASAQQAPGAMATNDVGQAGSGRVVPTSDPTGGAYTSPTMLFIPAAAVPVWNVRVIASTEVQSPSDVHAGFRPGLGAEVGLPAGVTIAAGTNWVGGDVNPNTGNNDFNLGLSPYFQARYHIYGDKSGQGFQLGTSLTYKFVGFEGDPGESELAMSAQWRQRYYELGLQAVIGQDFGDVHNHDFETHAYAVVRPIQQLALGGAGQVRVSLNPPATATDSSYDVIGGGIASLTLGQYQVAALAGATTLGLAQGQVGALGQVFGSIRF